MLRMRTTFLGRRLGFAVVALGVLCTGLALLLSVRPAEAAPAPTITAVSPATGPMAGGATVTITGTGFDPAVTVDFGGAAGVVGTATATSITVTTPAHAPASVLITVTNPDGQSATISGGYRFLGPLPTLTVVAPATGPTIGGTSITLTGTEFASGATVTVGGRAATSVSVTSATQLTAVTPWGVTGAADVVMTNADGQAVTLAGSFTYTQAPPPTVTAVSPTAGTSGGGTVVTITGTGFGNGATVRFGATAATAVTTLSATSIRATAPAGTTGQTVSVTVVNPDTQAGTRASAYGYFDAPAPTLTSVTPAVGAQTGGTVVVLVGTNFNAGATVNFGTVPGTVTSLTSTMISVLAPAQPSATKVDVTVINTDTKNAKLTSAFTYQKPPTLTKVEVSVGSSAGGTAITLTGTNFLAGMTVRVGGVLATDVVVSSTTSATAVTPAGIGLATVSVTNADGQAASLANAFTYVAPPTITGVTPVTGPDAGGTTITITGTGFTAGLTVKVGGVAATEIELLSATEVRAKTPAGTAGATTVVVTLSNGVSSAGSSFFYGATTGSITAGSIPKTGFGLIVFSGGTTDALVATATAAGCVDMKQMSFFAADGKGAFVSYIASAPSFVNSAWLGLFANGIPANQPLIARCG